jgi:hypothetical protein
MISFKPRPPGWIVKEDNIRDVCHIRMFYMYTLPPGEPELFSIYSCLNTHRSKFEAHP